MSGSLNKVMLIETLEMMESIILKVEDQLVDFLANNESYTKKDSGEKVG